MEVESRERLSMRHRRDWPTPLQGRLAVNKLNFCLPLAKGHILGALARHSRFSAAGLFAHFCIAQHMRYQYSHSSVLCSSVSFPCLVHSGGGMDGIPDRWDSAVDRLVATLERFGASQSSSQLMRYQEISASQSSLALVKPDKMSDDDIGSRACPKDELAIKVSLPDPPEDDCPPTQIEPYLSLRDLTPTKVEKKRFCADQATVTTKGEPQKELLALTLPVPAQRRARRRYQARWKPIELTIDAREKNQRSWTSRRVIWSRKLLSLSS
eukprot:3231521-Amphidinium_carterae.1